MFDLIDYVQIHIHYVHTYLNLYMYEFGRRRQEDVKKKQPAYRITAIKKNEIPSKMPKEDDPI